jgi:Uma2 family endonuclease
LVANARHFEIEFELVLVFRNSGPDRYLEVRQHVRGDRIAPSAFPDCELAVDEILR